MYLTFHTGSSSQTLPISLQELWATYGPHKHLSFQLAPCSTTSGTTQQRVSQLSHFQERTLPGYVHRSHKTVFSVRAPLIFLNLQLQKALFQRLMLLQQKPRKDVQMLTLLTSAYPLMTLFRGLPHCTCLKMVGKEFRLQPVSKILVSVPETGLEVVIKISLDIIFFTQNAQPPLKSRDITMNLQSSFVNLQSYIVNDTMNLQRRLIT